MAKKQYTYKDIVDIAKKAIDKWIRDSVLDEDAFTHRIHEALDKNQKQILFKILGFDTDYGDRLKLDHCNGRSGNSIAGEYLRSKFGDKINAWLDKQIKPLPTLPQEAIDSMREEYKSQLRRHLHETLRKRAEAEANKIIEDIINQIKNVNDDNLKHGLDRLGFLLAVKGTRNDE